VPDTTGVLGGNFIVSVQDPEGASSKEKNGNTLEVSGSIKLPDKAKKKLGSRIPRMTQHQNKRCRSS
jgi:hypothetical protein